MGMKIYLCSNWIRNEIRNIKYELAYSDFEDISISSTGGDNNNSVTAEADAITFRLSYGF